MPFRQRLRRLSQRIGDRIDSLFATPTANQSSASLPNSRGPESGLLSPPLNPAAGYSDADVPRTDGGGVIGGKGSAGLPAVVIATTDKDTLPPQHPSTGQSNGQQDVEAPRPSDGGGTADGWTRLRGFGTVLDRCTDVFGPLKAIVDELIACIETYQSIAAGRSDFRKLQTELEALFEDLERYYSDNVPPAATPSMESLCSSILKELAYVKEKQSRAIARQVIEAGDDADRVLACYRRVQGYLRRLALNANISIWKITDELATNARLDRLSPAHSACYKSSKAAELKRGKCTPGTRVDVLAQMHGWVHNRAAGSVYWLNGMAGTGKTTIAYTLCAELELAHNLGASFFCSRSLPECRDVDRIVPSIAYQLAQFSHPFRYALARVLEVERDVHTQLLHIQFEKLVVKPIQEVKATLPEDLVVVIDALDECNSKKSTRQILEALLTKTSDLPIKFFMASRPEPEIREQIKKQGGDRAISRLVLHELDKGTVQGDIETYLREALKPIDPSEPEIAELIERAGILFIYAATVVRYIGFDDFNHNPRKRLRNVLKSSSTGGNHPYREIDELYTLILEAAIDHPGLDGEEKNDTKDVLHTVLCAREPLTTGALSGLLGLHDLDRVYAALRLLWSVLHVVESSGLVTTLHASFPDYMFDSGRSNQFHCDQATRDQILSKQCFDCLKNTKPQFNICRLESSCMPDVKIKDLAARVKTMISPEALYASRYWGIHLQHTDASPDVLDGLYHFLSSQLLLWMEVANLSRYMTEGVEMLRRAEEWCTHQACTGELKQLVHASWQFAAGFASNPVSRSTPHIYVSMLPFWPTYSPISKHYAHRMHSTIQGPAIARRSLSILATWPMTSSTTCLAWSHDGAHITFVSEGQIYVRNSLTGQIVLGPLNQTSLLGSLSITTHTITSIGYSPDSARIISGSHDGTLCVWDSETGKKFLGPLKGHAKQVTSVAFSSDHNWIASGSEDNTVRIWDAQSGKKRLSSLKGHSDGVTSVAFSPNCTRVVSGSLDHTLRIWDAQTGQSLLSPLQGHADSVESVAFSHDGTRIVSGSRDGTIRLWDAENGQSVLSPFEAHTGWVKSIGFSRDGTRIVSGSSDSTIRLWDAQTGQSILSPLEGHTGTVRSAAFSPDGTRIASASEDKSVRMWDARTEQPKPSPLEGHTDSVWSVAFSPDGTRVVSGSSDNTIRMWDAQTGQPMLSPLKAHTNWVRSVAFSPDGTRIVSGSEDMTIRMWDAQTGQPMLSPLKGHTHWVYSVAFSPDGTRIVSGSWDDTIRMWDAQAGQPMLSPLKGHTGDVNSVALSPDGTRIVSGSDDKTIRMWDAQTGQPMLSPLKGHTSYVLSVAFSPDGTRIVSGSGGKTIRMWDAQTGQPMLSPLEGHTSSVYSVAFSPDGTRIVSGSDDNTIRMWDTQTGQPMLSPLEGHTRSVQSVAFSPDGTRIVSGSYDYTIRMWDVRTGVSMPSGSVLASPYSWEITDDGWVVDSDDKSKLLVWVPSDLRPLLLPPRRIFTTSTDGYVRLDFDDACIGTSWTECYQPRE